MVIIIVSISIALSGSIGRIGYIILGNTQYAENTNNSISVLIDSNEINLYYDNMTCLNNNVFEKYAIVRPCDKDIKEAYRKFSGEELTKIISALKDGKPVVLKVDNNFTSKYISTCFVKNSDYICKQLIDKESSGLLKHIKYEKSELKIRYKVDATGRMLSGDKGELLSKNYYNNDGVKLTLNKKIEQIVYDSSETLKSGCVIVMDVNSSDILAAVTKPDDSYMNKVFERYSAGSVFKMVTALCALENGADLNYNCAGNIKVGSSVFSCQKGKKHGGQNLKEALANSCNCYFVKLAITLGPDKLIKTAERMGFNDYTKLCNGWTVKNAGFNKNDIMSLKGETALFGFGQGSLSSTPLQICNMLCTISNGGYKRDAKLIKSFLDEEISVSNEYEKVISEYASRTLLSYLRNVVESGTGRLADYNGKCAGKTATAQTGRFENGREILNTWFAGVYPYDNPKYAIVVMCDDGESGSKNCCPVFRTIVEKLEAL